MASQIEELEASIKELQAELATAPPEMRGQFELQIESMTSLVTMLRSTLPQIEEMKKLRRPLTPELAAFFTPEPPANIPSWLPDTTTLREVKANEASAMRCPPEAKIYSFESSVSCSIPGVPGQSLSVAHGLSLDFRSDGGGLQTQSFFDRGRLRWAITYHTTGQRDAVGFWVSTEPKTYIEEGLHTRYAPNGTIVSQVHWSTGKQHGWDKKWEDDGYPIGATLHEHGTRIESVYADGSRTKP